MVSWDSQKEYQGGQPIPAPIFMEEGAVLGGYRLNTADNIISVVYSDHPHHNNSTQLNRGVANNEVWQRHCWITKNLFTRWYDAPLGCVGIRFVKQLKEELNEVRNR